MKQLTSYFSSKTTSSSSSAGGAAPVDTSDAKGGEENNDFTKSTSVKKKRPLTVGEAESPADDNLKKRKVNDDDDTNNNDGGIKSDHLNANNNSDDADEKADVTQHPDTPKQPIGSNEEGGESAIPPASTTATAISCPLQFLAAAVIMSPDAKDISSKSGSKIRNVEEEIVPMPKIISDLPFEDEGECEVKDDGNSGEGNKSPTTDEKVDTSIGDSTKGEGGESADVNNPDTTKPTTDVEGGDVDQTSKVEEAEVVSSQQTPSSEEQLANDDSPFQKIEEEGESSTTAVDDVEMENTSQSFEAKTAETTEGDASMDVDETTNTTSSDHLPQHEEDSTNAVIMTDAAPIHHQVSVSTTAESPPSPELLSTSSNNFETTPNTAKKAPTVSQLKMALFMEASRVHAGNKPERIFANYWDALEKYIAPPRHSSSAPRSDPSFKFNATLQLFLKTRKMKRLHNKLILALISDSVRDEVSGHRSGEHIPRVWRGRMRHLNLKSDDDGVELDNNNNFGSNNGLYDDWNSSFGNNADAWSACGNSVTIAPRIDQDKFVAKKREEREVEVSNDEIIPSCRLPGALEIDLFVKKIASDAGLTVSHDSMWLLIVAAREYASSIIGKAIDNDKNVTSGLMPRIPKSDYSSLSCEHLLSDKKGGKKKDSKKKESASKADKKSNGTERNESDKKRKVLNSADISQVLQEQHVAAPRLAWMRSMGRGMAQHQPDLKTTNDIINTSIQRAAIKRRRAADMKSSESHVAPVAAAEEKVHDESALGNESLDRGAKDEPGRKAEAAIEKRPSINMNDSAKKAPPKSSDLLKSNVPPAEPTTESSTAPAQSGPSPTVDSTTTSPPASENVTQIRQISKFGAKNLAAMKARRRSGSFRGKPEQGAGKEETPEKLVRYQSRTSGPATQSLSQQPVPVPASVSLTNPPGPAPVSVTNPPPSAPAPAPIIVKKLSKDEMEKLARYQQAARPVTQAQQPAPAPPSVTNQSTGLEEREKSLQSQYRQQQLDSRDSTLRQQQYKPRATSNTTQLWQETEMTMQSQVEQDEEEEEEVLPQPKLARTTNQF
ncbi:hypothetical protein QTG54_008001 [Skeletonema marinoi]|uniref:Uncharacterized protein n=1 Tax=Skeletonema marinoi TaxID=267567 RepID=A0AAD9DDD4_9STRA|nr:hypothetical protein QTG54_008001 [Skeletonema marinoi]